jgi:hypothetical protein
MRICTSAGIPGGTERRASWRRAAGYRLRRRCGALLGWTALKALDLQDGTADLAYW